MKRSISGIDFPITPGRNKSHKTRGSIPPNVTWSMKVEGDNATNAEKIIATKFNGGFLGAKAQEAAPELRVRPFGRRMVERGVVGGTEANGKATIR